MTAAKNRHRLSSRRIAPGGPRPDCAVTFLFLIMVLAFSPALRGQAANKVDIAPPDGQAIESYRDGHALVVGVEHYDHWPVRTNALQNAREVSTELKRIGFTVRLLIDPTAEELDSALNTFAQTCGRQPRCGLVFYYAGNGRTHTGAGGKTSSWIIPKDAPLPTRNLEGFEKKAIHSARFIALADQIQSSQVLFLFDAPFRTDDFHVQIPVMQILRDEDALPACQFITSGADERTGPNRDPFTKYLLLGLQGEADLIHDGVISGAELALYLSDRVARVTERQWRPQFGRIPVAAENRGDFIFKVARREQTPDRPPGDMQPFVNSLGMQFQFIQPGNFLMGSPPNEPGRLNDETRHRVKLTRPYSIQITEVTTGEFKQFVQSTAYTTEAEKNGGCWITGNGTGWKQKRGAYWRRPGSVNTDDDLPVVCVTWNDASAFARWLGEKEQHSYRLPTEAEWEYAGRAGTSTPFSTGSCLSTDEANYARLGSHYQESCKTVFKDQRSGLVKAAMLAPNPWKLRNIHGNVSEWCLDWYGPYPSKSVTNPRGPEIVSECVMRGGHGQADAAGCRCSRRWRLPSNLASDAVGFRLVMVP
jgi:formylglycine-generating enzyme required for sulfatase activity